MTDSSRNSQEESRTAHPSRNRILPWILIAALAAVGICAEWMLLRHRPGKTPASAEGLIAALGGFRSLAAEAVWFRADLLQEEGRYVELAQLASTLTFLEPHTPELWGYAAWNLAYNISVMMPTSEDRWRWVLAGLKLLRDDGLRLNPDDPDICRELAWLFQNKIGGKIDSSAPLYRIKWREIVNDAAARNAWQELGMDPERMSVVGRRFGISDWSNPQASAIYWAFTGLSSGSASRQTEEFLRVIIKIGLSLMDGPAA